MEFKWIVMGVFALFSLTLLILSGGLKKGLTVIFFILLIGGVYGVAEHYFDEVFKWITILVCVVICYFLHKKISQNQRKKK